MEQLHLLTVQLPYVTVTKNPLLLTMQCTTENVHISITQATEFILHLKHCLYHLLISQKWTNHCHCWDHCQNYPPKLDLICFFIFL
jgi:hypothetical protein